MIQSQHKNAGGQGWMDERMSLQVPIILHPNSCHVELSGLALGDGEFGKLSGSAG